MKEFGSEVRCVVCKRGVLEYYLTRKDVKNINLRIKSDGQISVSAKPEVSVKYIDDFIYRKQEYIYRNQRKYRLNLKEQSSSIKRYISGESVEILGKCLRLKVIEGEKDGGWTDGVFVFLCVKEKEDFGSREKLFSDWMKKMQEETFGEICGEVYKRFKKYDILYPELKIKDMMSRWGSCQPRRGIITLNSRLIEAPRHCIEYVILHEFVHFICPNHSKKFYGYMAMMMPDWEDRKSELEECW